MEVRAEGKRHPRARAAWWCMLVCGAAMFAASCGTPPVDPAYEALVEQESVVPPTGELGVGDRFQLSVHNVPELTGEFSVTDDGGINFPYAGRLEVAGMTCSDLEQALTKALADGYVQNPSVRCSITEYNSKRVFIFGEVRNPGSFPYKSNITIIEGIALAGGFADRANSNGTKLSRVIDGVEIRVTIPMQEIIEGKRRNIKILPGDIVFVPELPY